VLAAAAQYAEQAGVSLSEWCREVIYRAVYGEPATMEQGYMQGRAIAYQVFRLAMGELEIPATAEEGVRFLQEHGSPGRRRRS